MIAHKNLFLSMCVEPRMDMFAVAESSMTQATWESFHPFMFVTCTLMCGCFPQPDLSRKKKKLPIHKGANIFARL